MALASTLSIAAHLGFFGPSAQAFSALIALSVAFVTAPLIAWATKGRYYLARGEKEGLVVPDSIRDPWIASQACPELAEAAWPELVEAARNDNPSALRRCVICEREYEGPDMAHCPAYQGQICSLCCTLDARCGELCKPHASLAAQWSGALRWLLPRRVWRYLDTGLAHFLLLMLAVVPLLAALFGLLYHQEIRAVAQLLQGADTSETVLRSGFLKAYMALLVIAGIVAWWLVLAHKSRQVAQQESNRQTHLLMREIELHKRTDEALKNARLAAEQANQAKSRYISAISHELRTPLNSILGYAQLMGEDSGVPAHRKQAVNVIKRGGEHLLSLIEGTLDIARIESGKLTLNIKPMHFADCVHEMAGMFELQAAAKGLTFRFDAEGAVPEVVRADEKRVRQILINLLGNAIKFTAQGQIIFRVRYAREMAHIEIEDTGPGLRPEEVEQVFEPFARGNSASHTAPGAGLGLTIAKMLTDVMGGELTVTTAPGAGSVFRIKLFLPEVSHPVAARQAVEHRPRRGYAGARRKVLVVDNEEADRDLMVQLLEPLGFELRTAASGHDALDLLAADLQPDAILIDLAMPGIDGWETIRRLRRQARVNAKVAVVSANAFDKGLENAAGISPEDFILKPVRHSELLDWLQRQLGLRWLEEPGIAAPSTHKSAADWRWPASQSLRSLQEMVELGYYRGIMNKLGEIEAMQPECGDFAAAMRERASQFQFEAMSRELAASRPALQEKSP
jgi:signal transduction histidine kinase/CheY-like chemotaxis protein